MTQVILKLRHRRLLRSWMVRKLGTLSNKWKNDLLSYPEFCIRAYKEVNAYKSPDPHKNFSELEAIAGYIEKYGLNKILFLDRRGRPDLYLKREMVGERRKWNRDKRHTIGQIDIIPHVVREYLDPKTKRKHKQPKEVYNDYVEILEGSEAVKIVDNHLNNVENGIKEMRLKKSESKNVIKVEKYIAQLLEEFARRRQR